MSLDIEKRSIVLTKVLAKAMDKEALDRNCSFSALVRTACENLVAQKEEHSAHPRVLLTREERHLAAKLAGQLGVDLPAVLKKCFEVALPLLIEEVAQRKKKLEDLAKKLS